MKLNRQRWTMVARSVSVSVPRRLWRRRSAQTLRPAGDTLSRRCASGRIEYTVSAGAAARPRAESKGAKILELIGRPQGSTLEEILKVTQWQAHSVRGFLSTAAKKHNLHIESRKTEAGDRVYQTKIK